jgi:uncharacterized membrane protein YraQ (UPF0718 family)
MEKMMMKPPRKGRASMDKTTLLLGIITMILLIVAYSRGRELPIEGLALAGRTFWRNALLLFFGFAFAGLAQVLLPRDLIVRWLGTEAGIKGILVACVAGGLVPGPPYAVFPLVAGLYKAGAGLGSVVGFVSAWALWSVSRLPIEIALIGTRPAIARYLITFIVPPLAGMLTGIVS